MRYQGKTTEIAAKCVVLAAGGFQANAEWRTRYMGPGGAGQGARHALQHRRWHPHGARRRRSANGQLVRRPRRGLGSNAPEFGDLTVGDNFQKHNYPFSVMINANGERFVDEGATFATTPTPSMGA